MRLEIVSATDFLVQLLRLQTGQLSESQLQMFKSSLTELLRRRYTDHWFPDRPNRGSGYRCLRINGKMDPVIAQAGMNVGLRPTLLHNLFPTELTMWIDPAEVSYRIGENGSICVLFEGAAPQEQSDSSSDSVDDWQQQEQHNHHHHHHHHNGSPSSNASPAAGGHHHHHHHPHHLAQPQQQQSYHQQHHLHHHQQHQQQQFESCKDSLLLEHTQFSEQIAAFVSS